MESEVTARFVDLRVLEVVTTVLPMIRVEHVPQVASQVRRETIEDIYGWLAKQGHSRALRTLDEHLDAPTA